ncbi:MAG TPA: acyl carrier protein [Nitrosomonas nitrosa]|jgi:acyl carrier protein|uniref:Acyl carrier protein n=1 Tax=Nitrosomonas nitrosa TaxID=52442 RepID=A0A1I4Q8X7_9PROT|nr:acyl carrier protein [Nitrosomonas nitrosa]MCW5598896.1 acyl carrier protein [Nitrosomonas sp.]MCO6434116.1 acyl carrier protein [Nitrosomonas nitrosa]MCW5601711.1 acyl carrier protein [Nitrosomonas sp.]PTQ95435.1 acyl carrier protein [Nitrosomonas nitrosa]CAE6500909.1 Acyl carrier protein [Nitrosomonas nitrosa]
MVDINQEDILRLLAQRLASFANPELEITPDTNLITQLAIDSIKLLNLIMELEDHFDISIPLNALTDVVTVRDLANLVYKLKLDSK